MARDKPQKGEKVKKPKSAHGKPTIRTEAPSNSSIWQDERFQHLVSDPRFRGIPKVQRKVKIDKRFQSMFTDDKFKVKYTVDKYGRRVNKSNAEDLRKYYEINTSDSETDEEGDKVKQPSAEVDDDVMQEELEKRKEEKAISRDNADDSGESTPNEQEAGENDEFESDGEEVPKTLRERLLNPNIDYARGEGRLVTDSSSDEESSEEEEDLVANIDHVWGELDQEAETTKESTNRLAVCNMDWDRIRAVDLMVLFSSFLPPGGSVLSVTIYPSEFGKERMREEDVHGPTELIGLRKELSSKKRSDAESDSDEELVQEQDSDAEEGDEYHMEKLRQYQLNRLRYYYAVAVFDSVATADKIYKECDGIEYESSATRVDLRVIPNGTSFDDDEATDVCTDLPDTNSYQPRQFTTTALQQAKVDLTWDETAIERQELGEKLASGKLDEVSDRDLRKIVAYSSEEEEEDEEDQSENAMGKELDSKEEANGGVEPNNEKPKRKKDDVINKYKALLAEINEKEKQKKNKKFEMELTWHIEQNKDKVAQETDPEWQKKEQQLTPIEKVLKKRNEKNKQRKEERKKKKMQVNGLDPDANNDSDSIPDGIDMNDPYFAEEFATGEFVDPKAKKRENMKKQENALDRQQATEEEERQAKELQLLLDDDDAEEQGKQHFSLEKILKSEQETKSKRKRRKQLKKSKSAIANESKAVEDNFQLNINDARFQAVFTSAKFNIDPTDSHFKKTKAMELLIQEKLKRRHGNGIVKGGDNDAVHEVEAKRPKKQLENKLLVNSLKRKIQLKQQK
ncbi:ESF1 homolog [Eurosta solidaginis]|uniref:ESF1 homolog n=1 Tax=Eurosta solidaginis TaxID=178769 RepID=UPI003530B3C6